MLRFILVIALFFPARAFTYPYPEANERLKRTFQEFEQTARSRRWLNTGLFIGGAALFGLGSTWAVERKNAANFGILAILFTIAGVVTFYNPTEFETLSKAYPTYLEENPLQVQNKVKKGQQMLREFGQRAERERLWGGTILTTLGAMELLFYGVKSRGADDEYLLLSAPLVLGLGLSILLNERMETTRAREYDTWNKAQLQQSWVPELRIHPFPKGFVANVNFRF